MHKKGFLVIVVLPLIGCGPGQIFGPTVTPIPTSTPTPTATPTLTPTPTVPTYSEVLESYGHEPSCGHIGFFIEVLDRNFSCDDVVYIRDQDSDGDVSFCVGSCSAVLSASPDYFLREEGVKIETEAEIVLDGVTYAAGTKLTVDSNLNWIEVSSWD